jgi:hypothetical protein
MQYALVETDGVSARLRGSLVPRWLTRAQPTDVVIVERETLRCLPWLRKNYEVRRDEIDEIIVEKGLVTTNLKFVLKSGRTMKRIFRPVRRTHAIEVLKNAGWPVRE